MCDSLSKLATLLETAIKTKSKQRVLEFKRRERWKRLVQVKKQLYISKNNGKREKENQCKNRKQRKRLKLRLNQAICYTKYLKII